MTTYFVYDGDEVAAEYDGSGNLLAEYVYGDNIDEVLLMERGGSSYYYHQDGLGSVTEVTNASGVVAESYTYDPYGNPSVTSSLIGNPYMFTGRRWDEETGIYYYRARMYSPEIGRFLQRDPLGYWDSMNLYSYVINNPGNAIDPSGKVVLPLSIFAPIVIEILLLTIIGMATYDVCMTWNPGANQPGGNPLPSLEDLGINSGWNPYGPIKNLPKLPPWYPLIPLPFILNELLKKRKNYLYRESQYENSRPKNNHKPKIEPPSLPHDPYSTYAGRA